MQKRTKHSNIVQEAPKQFKQFLNHSISSKTVQTIVKHARTKQTHPNSQQSRNNFKKNTKYLQNFQHMVTRANVGSFANIWCCFESY
jgi:hypothetical protein